MGKIFLLFLLVLVAIGGAFFIKNDENINIFSPTSEIFGESSKKEIENVWFPKQEEGWQFKNFGNLYVSAKAALIVDYDTGEVLFAKDASAKLPAASTIKIMTAIAALENADLGDMFGVSANAAQIGENSVGLERGERLTLEELLYGMMLVSGNDAAITVAEGIAGSEQKFVEIMNTKANKIGLKDTKFVNATGLDEDGKTQYSTAYDMAVIAHYGWENYPEIRKIASTYEKYIEATNGHKDYLLYNDTNLLTSYPGVRGIKPGFSWDARWCLVTYVENEGKKLLGIVLGSEDRRGEMALLLDYGFSKYKISVEHPGLDL